MELYSFWRPELDAHPSLEILLTTGETLSQILQNDSPFLRRSEKHGYLLKLRSHLAFSYLPDGVQRILSRRILPLKFLLDTGHMLVIAPT